MTGSGTQSAAEITIRGIGVSPGVVVGPVFLLTADDDYVQEYRVSPDNVPREIGRFEEALIETRRQIKRIQQDVVRATHRDGASIFDAHLMVLDDGKLIEEVIGEIRESGRNVEGALKFVAARYTEALSVVDDDYLRERTADIKDVVRRLLRNLSGKVGPVFEQLDRKHIVVANDLSPSDTAAMRKDVVQGFATDLGSPTSHTAVMARALEIPAIVGLHDITLRVSAGDEVLIDGNKGILIVRPTPERLQEYGKVIETRRHIETGLTTLKGKVAETKDGHRVVLSANVEGPEEIDTVLAHGAYGVGLFRTEYLFLTKDKLPTEDQQAEVYDKISGQLAPAPVIIRTLDIGGDKFLSDVRVPREMNPFLGCRAIRLSLAQPEMLKSQIRAILRASSRGNVKIMYPMISNAGEVIRANEILEEAKEELRAAKMPFDESIEVGAMIETPSAALTADVISEHVQFFSLGTNDLIQYTLAVDRVNERVAYLYEPTHPAILRLIKHTIDVGHKHKVWVGLCGEMGGDPVMAPLLVGLGIDELSAVPSAVPLVKDVIRNLTREEARELAERSLAARTAGEVLQYCRKLIEKVAPEILELTG